MEPSSSVEPTNLQVNFYSQLLSRIQALSGGKAGLFALALATIGLYGTMAYSITRKTHEIGIRMASAQSLRTCLAWSSRKESH